MAARLSDFLDESLAVELEEQKTSDAERALRLKLDGLTARAAAVNRQTERVARAESSVDNADLEPESRLPKLPTLPELEESLSLRRFMVKRRRLALTEMERRLREYAESIDEVQSRAMERTQRLHVTSGERSNRAVRGHADGAGLLGAP